MKFWPMLGWALRGSESVKVTLPSTSMALFSLWLAFSMALKRLKLLLGRVPCEYFSDRDA